MKQSKKQELFVFNCKDKEGTTSPFDPNNLCDFFHPATFCCAAPTSSGKTSLIKNIILHQKPEFEKVYLWHFSPETTTEYDDVHVEMLYGPPTINTFKKGVKSLMVIEDVSFSALSKQENSDLNRMFGYISSHLGISIILTSQTFTAIPVQIRRMCNVVVVWKGTDRRVSYVLSAMMGIAKKDLDHYFSYCKTRYDFLCISNYPNYPKVSLNIYEVLKEAD